MNAQAQLTALIRDDTRARRLDLRGADLAGSNLARLSADGLNLRAADLRDANLREVRLSDCRLECARLDNADCSGATIRMCTLDGAQAANARFVGARLEDSTVLGADLSHANLLGAHLTETSFSRAVLRRAVLDSADGDGVEFRGADLGDASLIGVRLDEADFRGADLRWADLTRGRFRGANFRGALLDGARFDGVDCEGALFDEGQMQGGGTTRELGEQEMAAWDELAIEFLRGMLTEIHTASGAPGNPDAELFKGWPQTADALLTDSDQPPEAWKTWIESLMKKSNDEPRLDLKAVVDALSQGPADLRSMLAGQGALAVQLLDRLRSTAEKFDVAPDQLPEEWRLWLERLSKMTSDKRTIDPRALFDDLSLLAKRRCADKR